MSTLLRSHFDLLLFVRQERWQAIHMKWREVEGCKVSAQINRIVLVPEKLEVDRVFASIAATQVRVNCHQGWASDDEVDHQRRLWPFEFFDHALAELDSQFEGFLCFHLSVGQLLLPRNGHGGLYHVDTDVVNRFGFNRKGFRDFVECNPSILLDNLSIFLDLKLEGVRLMAIVLLHHVKGCSLDYSTSLYIVGSVDRLDKGLQASDCAFYRQID